MNTGDRDLDRGFDDVAADIAVEEQEPARRPPDVAPSPAPGVTDAQPASEEPSDDAREFVALVDTLADLTSAPVHSHAARYHQVHTQLQDALSEADRGGTASR